MNIEEKGYGVNEIDILEGLEAVRKRPSMYIGSTCSKGLHHLVYEIVDNSIDEGVAGYCDNIDVSILKENIIKVSDNGRGIPTGIHPKTNISAVETILTTLHAGGKFGNGGYKISGGLHGVGSSVVNALSEYLKIIVCREGKVYEQEYKYGKPLYQLKVTGESDKTGTTIIFKPDKDIFETTKYNYSTLENRLRELAYLNNDIKISLTDERGKEDRINTYYTDKGVAGYLQYINQNQSTLNDNIIRINKELENYQIDIALQYLQNDGEIIYTYANNIKTTEGGVHLEGFKNAIRNSINNYAVSNNFIKQSEKFIGEDVRSGLTAIISVKLPEPQFEGQTKTKLGNADFKPIVEQSVTDILDVYLIENLDYAKQIIDNAITSRETRIAMKQAKESIKKKKSKSKSTKILKLSDCLEKDPKICEIHLVEGDGAGGSAKSARDRNFQAILPQKGKSMNAEKYNSANVLNSQELKNISDSIGTSAGKDFDINKLRYHKIIIQSDADPDGRGHITPLILTYIYRYMKPLLIYGYVYIALPPLFKNTINKKRYFTYTDEEQQEFLSINKGKVTDIQRFKGLGEMNPDELWETTMNPTTRRLLKVSIDDDISANQTCSLLMGAKVEPRRDFIIENAKFVKYIDI